MRRTLLVTLSLVLACGAAYGQYSRVVAVGDSLTAGFMSGGLVDTYQVNSYPALIARQIGIADFEQPLVSEPGIPALLTLNGLLNEYGVLSPTIEPITEDPAEWGVPTNLMLERPYDNLAVPGATLNDSLNTVTDGGGMHDLVLRGLGTQVQQALSLQPDLIVLWIGNNDALGAALSGMAIPGVTLTPKDMFATLYEELLSTLTAGSSADIVAATIPDVTTIPFVTTVAPYIVDPTTGQVVTDQGGNPVLFLGQNDDSGLKVSPDSYILLTALDLIAQGYGIPATLGGNGQPLPDEVVLTPMEVATIQEYVDDFNATIATVASSYGVPVLDAHAILDQIAGGGIEIAGMEFNADLLTGGLISYDGIHLTTIGYAIVANYFIDLVNGVYGTSIEPINLADYFFSSSVMAGTAAPFIPSADNLDPMIEVLTRHILKGKHLGASLR